MPASLVEGTLSPCTMENPADDEKQQLPSPVSGDLPEGLVLVSSGSEGPDEDEDHEEGEIQDEDDEGQQQELEDISSEEESTIRERMAALEAMDKKVGMMKRKFAKHSKYDYLDVEEVMNGKENYYYYPQHQHPPHRTHKPYKASTTSKEDNRYADGKHTRSVATKRNAEKTKEKGSKRSSHRSRHKRRRYASRSPAPAERHPHSSDSEPEAAVDREYLKLALGIGNGRSQRHSSTRNPLKKKLLLQTAKRKRKSEVKKTPVVEESDESDAVVIEDDADEEEEEEELQLRLLALSTKPIVREAGLGEIISEFQIPSPPPPPTINQAEDRVSDAVSAEEQELRLIALKTAVLKKHASRKKRRELDNEQPYSPSDDIMLSPVREVPPVYDNGVYSDGHDSVEMIEDDADDVQIVEPQYVQIDLVDSDDNGNDMEISPLGSPTSERGANGPDDMEEDSQQPIDMELASSDSIGSAPSPAYSGNAIEQRLLLAGTDSCDSALFHRRGDLAPASPSVTPDSMEEAEAEALRHLLLTKMRQKQSKQQEVVDPPSKKVVEPKEQEPMETVQNEHDPVVQCEEKEQELPARAQELEQETDAIYPTSNENTNLITILDRRTQRKRKKKSLSNSANVPVEQPTATDVTPAIQLPPEVRPHQPQQQEPAKPASVVHTQKLVNNPNKLINLNRTAVSAPSPPLHLTTVTRTESPKELTTVDTFVSRPVAKLVIQLGHSDSDSEVDFSASSPEKKDDAADSGVGPVVPVVASGTTTTTAVRFEEQLDKFLKSVRSKSTTAPTTNQEDGAKELAEHSGNVGERVASSEKSLSGTRQHQQSRNAAKKLPTSSSGGGGSNAVATPTAVRHLSKSAQMEYMRLVARMAQLERDKLARQNSAQAPSSTAKDNSVPKPDTQKVANSGSVVEQKSAEPRPARSPGKRKQSLSIAASQLTTATTATTAEAIEEQLAATATQDPIERKLQQIRSSLPNLSEASRNRLLLTAEKQLEKHSGAFMSELERHNATILEAQQARRELFHLESRIELLKEKLALLESVYEKRRHRSYDTISSLQATRKKILLSRKRSGELERMCYQIGRTIKGETYQLPATSSGTVVQQQLRILIAETRELRNIRKPTLQEFKDEMIANHRRRLAASSTDDQPGYWKTVTYDNEECDEGRSNEVGAQREDEDGDAVAEREQMNTCEAINRDEEPVPEESCLPVEAPAVKEQSEQVVEEGEPHPTCEEDERVAETEPAATVHTVAQTDEASIAADVIVQEQEIPNDVEPMPMQDPSPGLIRPEDTGSMQCGEEGIVPGETFRIEKYTSPLMSLKQGAQNIPTGILCPFELGGQCVDRDCKYEHFSERRTVA
ncbi:uncharacterized protein LOC118516468 [Anopheles stephensi]|uniref:uncharacterized protein LOC118516468 n=1 Tax=Anopheles stephensi TaxID=30069 RepID=UPI001658725C|nr:uncharacterized protein LOC118516468 [Anopheles stephensi]